MEHPLPYPSKEESDREWLRLYNFPVVVFVGVAVRVALVAFVALAVQSVLVLPVADQSQCQP
jgi:hypothetical protein